MHATEMHSYTNRVRTSLPPNEREEQTMMARNPISLFLGVFSIGLGLAELLATDKVAQGTGVRGRDGLLKAYGAREMLAGAGILTSRDPSPWLWSRVAGDALDLLTLGQAYREAPEEERRKVMMSMAAVAGVAVLDVVCAINAE